MAKLPVAVQVYSVREDAEKDFKGTIQKIKDIGYDAVELAGLYGMSAQEVRKVLDEVGIRALSAHVPYVELIGDTEKTIDDYITIGCEYIAVPYLTEEYRPGTPEYPHVIEEIERIGRACKQKGVTLLYHNHDFEFAKCRTGSMRWIICTKPSPRIYCRRSLISAGCAWRASAPVPTSASMRAAARWFT